MGVLEMSEPQTSLERATDPGRRLFLVAGKRWM
jgi:hypothetical protein